MEYRVEDFVTELHGTRSLESAKEVWFKFNYNLGARNVTYCFLPYDKLDAVDNIIVISTLEFTDFDAYFRDQYPTGVDRAFEHLKTQSRPLITGIDFPEWLNGLPRESYLYEHEVSKACGRSALVLPLGTSLYGRWGGTIFMADHKGPEFRLLLSDIQPMFTIASQCFHSYVEDLIRKEICKRIKLAPREREALTLSINAVNVKDIAHKMNIKPSTAYGYLKSARQKLKVTTTTHAVVKAFRCGLLEL